MPVNNKNGGEAIDTRLVRRLADILNETNLGEIEVERGDLKIRVARGGAAGPNVVSVPAPTTTYAPASPAAPAAAAPAAQADAAPAAAAPGEVVKSPMVGTAYLQANPESEPFVQIGARVTEGQTLLIIEAMKTMNPIPAPRAGVVLDIVVDNEQPVEFGEPLIVIE